MPVPFRKLSPKAVKKSDIEVGTKIKQIFNNLGEILKILVKWR